MKTDKKHKAISLRRRGYSLSKISSLLSISKSTASLWLRAVDISPTGKKKLLKTIAKARSKGGQVKHLARLNKERLISTNAHKLPWHFKKSVAEYKFLAALLYWCEGEKKINAVRFTNSDPNLVKLFLRCLHGGFTLNNKKFRVCLHLHAYHNKEKQKKYWSRITGIPTNQFLKIHKKNNTRKRIKDNYPGCVSIRYHDVNVAIELAILQKILSKKGV